MSQTPKTNDDDASEDKIEALAEIICRSDEAVAALFVLMGTIGIYHLEFAQHLNEICEN